MGMHDLFRASPSFFYGDTMDTRELMDKLFHWKTTLEHDGITFYIRVVPDATIEDARRSALIDSRRLRKSLRDPDSEDYLLHIDIMHDLTDEELKQSVINLAQRDVAREYAQFNPRQVLEPLGDYPSQEQQEQYEEAKEQREKDFFSNLQAHLVSWQNDFRAALEKRDRAQIEGMYHKLRMDRVCEDEFSRSFEDRVVTSAVFTDDTYKKNMFKLDEYRMLPTVIKTKLRDAYNNLAVDGESVKN